MNNSGPGSPRRILLLEDEPVVRELFKRLLGAAPYALTLAPTVKDGLRETEGGVFDLLISDLRLRDGSGIEVIRRFRDKFPNVPILVVTGSLTPEERIAQVSELGIRECIQKPFELQTMQRAVEEALAA
jgi:DNA-binding response OmpR family regulator